MCSPISTSKQFCANMSFGVGLDVIGSADTNLLRPRGTLLTVRPRLSCYCGAIKTEGALEVPGSLLSLDSPGSLVVCGYTHGVRVSTTSVNRYQIA